MAESTTTKVTNAIVACCAVLLTWHLVMGGGESSPESSRRLADSEWQGARGAGQLIGPAEAPVQFVIFEDFECAICGGFARSSVPGVVERYPDQVAFRFRHYPLPYHRAALPAAIGAECAAAQQWFARYRAHLFANQERLNADAIIMLGVESGVPDSVAFDRCVRGSETSPAVDRDRTLAQQLGVPGTPGILVNGFLLRTSPDSARFAALVDSLVREFRR